MLPRAHRLTRPEDFAATVRRAPGASGCARVADRLVVVHLRTSDAGKPPRVGFVVSKAVGNAVVRNRTKRRLRALLAGHVSELPAGTDVVVRANPAASSATYDELAGSVIRLLGRACR